MPYRTILVHCDSTPASTARVGVAARLAARHDAKLVGVFATERPLQPAYLDAPFVVDLVAQHESRWREQADLAKSAFEKAASAAGVAAEWRRVDGEADRVLELHARYADLVVVGQYEAGAQPEWWRGLPEGVAMAAGRPALVVPYIGVQAEIGGHVLLAWNGSREATRAAADALPLLAAARKVTVLVVDPRKAQGVHGEEPGADCAAWLARHGVKVEVVRDSAADTDVGSVILSRVSDLGVDLVVMGVYGHSRLREFALGGASRSLLQQMTVPVLVSH